MDPKTKFKLFKQNKNFCAVPWTNFQVYTNGDFKTCSYGQKIFGNVNETDIEDILKSKEMLQLKQDMLDDKPNPNCVRCHSRAIAEDNFEYLKGHYNHLVKKEDVDYTDIENFDLRCIDLHWSNVCNLRCIMCHPGQSSLIAKDMNMAWPTVNAKVIQTVIDMVVKNQYNLKEIYLSGGEPFYIPHNVRLLKAIDNKDVPLRINTNMHWTDSNKVYEQLKNFNNVQLTMSADAIGEKFDYIRKGASWKTFIENVEKVRNETNFEMRVNTIFSVINADTIDQYIEHFYNIGIKDITINILFRPVEIDARNYPEHKKSVILDKLQKISEIIKDNNNLKNNIQNCIDQINKPKIHEFEHCLDRITATHEKDWRDVFKDLT